ncbi:unnamed protein product (macronuclear) [Paramecium tetraurelia]|uniref:MsrB domain-containing protein n=1 Tax=Paramecium tetraurelia TaxID=5888 RepID=A0CJS4_PARTE|nr:uncharacterized protein GSPATT00000753001 [Paramecium tetraurelia]CAK71041.1 unnamed protein product [Paramecium tetraurelia]|eukprot:XP_001438438.1 hypothetical protein (macronuclear) [Paramecium tetraurelia strain d4-2]
MKIKFLFNKILDALNKNLIKPQKKIEIRLDRLSMDPHHYWIAVGKGMERPFTGEFCNHEQQGVYQCYHCKITLFQSDTKYQAQTGYASFFQHHKNSVKIIETKEKFRYSALQCMNCQSYLGQISKDGPPPTFLRYSINSGALKFYQPKSIKQLSQQSQQ